ncbi:MAG: alpha-amylase family glycosyl hydrolase [Thermoanaerobaculia bacterium]|nr:alpha-amylase family glycosyl hydrolase [Thermoanaerobaculia bacterium]
MPLFVSRAARRRLRLDGGTLDPAGRATLASPARARELAESLREVGASETPPRPAPGAAALAALDRIAAALERLIDSYGVDDLFERALESLYERFGSEAIDALLERFAGDFALPWPATRAEGETPVDPGRAALLRTLLLFWVIDGNPAAAPINDFLHRTALAAEALYQPVIASLREFLQVEAAQRGDRLDLVDLLLEPQRREAGSLAGQLRFLVERWTRELGGLADDLLRGVDLLEEEERPRFPPGPGPAEVPSYDELPGDARSFSSDREWMPRLVLLAKNAYVWLDQLSRTHESAIRRLDQIPAEVLDTLAESGFTGLWLIGLWERSEASARIKRLCGNPEAVGSAYSLKRYRIAADLGGEEALEALAERAGRRGIRLAADMVPNHLGIDSDWVLRHPERFLGLDECPYPNYTFDGPDLSPDPTVGIFLEDGYYDRSDAAVVFKRVDRTTGRVRYLYHGNDGTGTAWNDTAQLDFLQPEVREAVTRTILEVARRFPVIRFDAAMTLTRHHFQRLWYPPPGGGGAIPSRAENGIETSAFDAAMPREFWREVVDRAAAEVPNTLLLAEAFWLLEGYFVRSLGMHRVYNSAFMNMLRDGETAKYRRLIRETVAFDPEILQRYVNFMSNPDERTARDQFGDGDRYFGVATVMATLPGLPMFAHGQVEGLREKYGMEYRQAYRREPPDHALIARHERQIAPLLKRRREFAGARRFRLFDLVRAGGEVDESVLAYSNAEAGGPSVVVFNNRDAPTRGRLVRSAPYLDADGREATETLAQALALAEQGAPLVTFHDEVGRLDYLARRGDLVRRGLEVELGPWEARVLSGFGPPPAGGPEELERLADRLGPAGVPGIPDALDAISLEPLQEGLRGALAGPLLERLLSGDPERLARPADDTLLEELAAAWEVFARAAAAWRGGEGEPDLDETSRQRLVALVALPAAAWTLAEGRGTEARRFGRRLRRALRRGPELLVGLFCQLSVDAAVRRMAAAPPGQPFREWRLGAPLVERLTGHGVEGEAARRLAAALGVAWRSAWGRAPRLPAADEASRLLRGLTATQPGRDALGLHPYEGHEYLVREDLEGLLDTLLALESLAWCAAERSSAERLAGLEAWQKVVRGAASAAEEAGYRLDRLVAGLAPDAGPAEEPSG